MQEESDDSWDIDRVLKDKWCPYQVLHLDKSCSIDRIRASFHSRSVCYYNDEVKFTQICLAYR